MLIRKYIPHSCSVKSEECIADILKQPADFISKAKRYIKKNFNGLEKEPPARTNQTTLLLIIAKNHKRRFRTF